MGEKAAGYRQDAVRLGYDAVLQSVVEFGSAVYRNGRPAGGVDGCDEFYSRFFHHPDSSKWRLQERWAFDGEREICFTFACKLLHISP